MIVALVALNVVGAKEASKLSVTLAVVDFATQVLLVLIGFALVFSPEILVDTSTGARRRRGRASRWPCRSRCSPTPASRRSRTSPRRCATRCAACPTRTSSSRSPSSPSTSRCRYRALGAAGQGDRRRADDAAGAAAGGGRLRERPRARCRRQPRHRGRWLDGLQIYVGILAATILFIATNAGVIGASRITYSMATYRQPPEIFRRLHPRFKTPWLSLLVFAGIAPIAVILPGDVDLRRDALLLRRDPLVHRRARLDDPPADAEGTRRTRSRRGRGPTSALALRRLADLRDRRRAGDRHFVRGDPRAERGDPLGGPGWPRPAWSATGSIGDGSSHQPPTETVRAPAAFGPALALEYRRLLVPVVAGSPSDEAIDVACGLAAERGARITALSVYRGAARAAALRGARGRRAAAHRELAAARAIGESYRPGVLERLARARSAGEAIVQEAERRACEIIVLGAPRRGEGRRGRGVFGATVDHALRNAPCRVLVTAAREAG